MRNYIYGKNSCKNALVRNNTIKNIFLLDGFKDPTIYKIIKEKDLFCSSESIQTGRWKESVWEMECC